MIRLYLLTHDEHLGYDSFNGMVVAAMSAKAARNIHPRNNDWDDDTWVNSPDKVNVEYIGIAAKGIKPGTIIITDFHAG